MVIDVNYIHHCGDDLSVVNAARVSFNTESKELSSKDVKLIEYLARNKHYTPFKHQFITMRIKAPIFVARQLVKHEYMPWNEISGRYVEFEEEFYEPDKWRKGSKDIKQGSLNEAVDLTAVPNEYWDYEDRDEKLNMKECLFHLQNMAMCHYRTLINAGVAKEQARMILPLNLMTEWYWSGALFSWIKMCSLRLDPHAQAETRIVAEKAYAILLKHFPVSAPYLLESMVLAD